MTNALLATATITKTWTSIDVAVVWNARVDRPSSFAYGLPLNKMKLAERLCAAINAQKVCLNPTIKTDVNGRTYVECKSQVIGRTMSSDLKRLGF